MSLVDLSSDLSKYRAEVSKESKNTPETSKARNSKNFAAFQPITEKLSSFSPKIQNTKPQKLEKKLDQTRLDDIRKIVLEDLVLNQVSKFSSINKSYGNNVIGRITTEEVVSRFNDIRRGDFVSRLDVSNVVVTQSNLMSNKKSIISINRNINDSSDNISNPDIKVNNFNQTIDRTNSSPDIIVGKNEQSNNIVNPNISVSNFVQSLDREKTSPSISKNINDASDNIKDPKIKVISKPFQFDREKSSPFIRIKPNEQSDNIVNPNVEIQSKPQSIDRKKQSVVIKQDLLSPINNIINPEIALQKVSPISDRVTQTPSILTTTVQSGLVTNPDTQTVRVKNGTYHLVDESRLNVDNQPVRFISRGVESIQTKDNSRLNIDKVSLTDPTGRNENPLRSKYSVGKKMKAVNFFTDFNAKGFVIDQQQGTSYYKPNSVYTWKGKRGNAPTTNFITDVNGKGFTKFARPRQTDYDTNSSEFSFINVPETNFFDQTKRNTTNGFKSFIVGLQSDYVSDSSRYAWKGDRTKAPETNFLDTEKFNTTKGFEKFSQSLISRYKDGSSVFDWDGKRGKAPGVDFLDKEKKNTRRGFQTFSRKYLSYYIPDSSEFNWDGKRINAPATDFFDINQLSTVSGFDTFAQSLQSKYQPDASDFQWKGSRINAPATDFFDRPGNNTLAGFHTFAQVYNSKYRIGSSALDWDGARTQAPEVNFFDVLSNHTSRGFEKFTTPLLSRYVKESSKYDWDGSRQQAPEVNYFDVLSKHTTKGFERFPQNLITRYVKESSKYDWDGSKQQSPEVNFFDLTGKFTSKGFERFTRFLGTRYVKEASQFDWNGTRQTSPQTNFFENTNAKGFTRLARKLETEYKKNTSEFVFKGTLPKPVDFFDINKRFSTGFTNKARSLSTEYKKNSSRFVFDASTPGGVDFFVNTSATGFTIKKQKLTTRYKKDTSQFTFKGSSRNAPAVDYFPTDQYAVGFTTFPVSYITKFKRDVTKYSFKGSIPLNKPREQMAGAQILRMNQRPGSSSFIFSPFFIKAQALVTEFVKDSSRYGWAGSRQESPEVDFLRPNNIRGFTRLFEDRTQTKLSDKYSFYSLPGSIFKANLTALLTSTGISTDTSTLSSMDRNSGFPATSFFGFNQTERSGFMLRMDTPYSTLYPIIEPRLYAGDSELNRVEVENYRGATYYSGNPTNDMRIFLLGFEQRTQDIPRLDGRIVNQAPIKHRENLTKNVSVNKTSDDFSEGGLLQRYLPKSFFVRINDGYTSPMIATLLQQTFPLRSPRSSYMRRYGTMVKFSRTDPNTLKPTLIKRRGNTGWPQDVDEEYLREDVSAVDQFQGGGDGRPNAHGVGFGYLASWYTGEGYWTKKNLRDRSFSIVWNMPWMELGKPTRYEFMQEHANSTPLNSQYTKYNLQDESVNNEPGALFKQPYIVRGIQAKDSFRNQRWGLSPFMGLENIDFAPGGPRENENSLLNALSYPFQKLPKTTLSYDEGIVRAGIFVQADRTLWDFVRISKFMASVKGLMFTVKQFGLQAMNPTVDVNPSVYEAGFQGMGISSTLLFNPLLFLANIGSGRAGIHLPRHGPGYPSLAKKADGSNASPFNLWSVAGVLGAGPQALALGLAQTFDFSSFTDSKYYNKYEEATITRELTQRFVGSDYKEFDNLPSNSGFGGKNGGDVTSGNIVTPDLGIVGSTTLVKSDTLNKGVRDLGGYSRLIGLMKELLPGTFQANNENHSNPSKELYKKSEINRLSTLFGGAQSFLGIGGTKFTRAGHPYLTFYTTAPNLSTSNSEKAKQLDDRAGQRDSNLNLLATSILKIGEADKNFKKQPTRTFAPGQEPQYLDSAKRNIYYAAKSDRKSGGGGFHYTDYFRAEMLNNNNQMFGAIQAIAYNNVDGPRLRGDTPNTTFNGDVHGLQPQDATRITKYDTFNPRFPETNERTRTLTSQTKTILATSPMSFGPTDAADARDPTDPIKQYRTSNYSQLFKIGRFNDFRDGVSVPWKQQFSTATFMTSISPSDTGSVDFQNGNLEQKFGFGSHGKPGSRRDKNALNKVQYYRPAGSLNAVPGDRDANDPFRGDRINLIDRKRGINTIETIYEKTTQNVQGKEDLIDFFFQSLNLGDKAETLVFRATFDSITDNHKPSWSPQKYMGRADPLYVYSSYEREISFGFTVHISSRDEMRAVWRKLNYLASWTTPVYTSAAQLKGPMVRLTIGHLYRHLPGYISSLTYTFDNTQTTWETAKLPEDMNPNDPDSSPGVLQLPKTINVSVSYVPVGNYRPEWNSSMYSLFDDRDNNLGIIPTSKDRVNYFLEDYPTAVNTVPVANTQFDFGGEPAVTGRDSDTAGTTYDVIAGNSIGFNSP